ncbi:pseudouridine-metabolizing bifunctional protein C1861.05-like isoform X3 [Trachemys scripta elegans]|uniref:pseudouridine-metabolizing bifunctional protein C1861.05-like isoform X3 n=1 Tax=Trachemys scripta elegans TaxID=31138 RepID=UPI0015534F00|nr:pseudouridine-metabolizing bifunctional protein C1861.05-like isoform X3 [Trachemys scripta elegans]
MIDRLSQHGACGWNAEQLKANSAASPTSPTSLQSCLSDNSVQTTVHVCQTETQSAIPAHSMIGNLACTLGRQTAAVAPRIIQMRRFLHGTHFRVSSSVEEALADGRPIIALESTIITHGMPYPQNLSMAREVEEIVRTNGSVPATVGILNGRIHIGLNDEELQFLAKSKNLVKVSRRDLPYVLSQGLSGGTTVSGTMIVAHKAGIPVFVTGGIGGVHREGEKTMDVSADLTELGRTAVAVVSAGVKSILDIGRTLEYLETQGVCVAAFGDSREFPAFFSRHSGFQAPCQVQNEEEAAKLIASTLALGLGSGVLIAVPCPKEEAASGQVIEAAIQEALSNARSKGITGKELTPFMLQKVNELTSGKSLDSNIALIQNNARVGSRIAVALSKIQTATGKRNLPRREKVTALRPAGGQTNAGQVSQSFGGVGRNLADCLSRLGKTPLFISALGKDEHSESILRYCRHMDMAGVLQLAGHSTATYCAVITGSGELSLGLGDMDIHQQITEQYVSKFKESLCLAPLVCIDGNVPVATIQYVCEIAREHQIAVCYEPTDENKASKPFLSDSWKALTYISPNLRELRAINRTLGHPVLADLPSRLEDVVRTAMTLTHPLLTQLHCVVVTLGMHGVLLCGRRVEGSVSLCPGTRKQNAAGELCATHYPAIPISREEIVNVSGAGDSLMAGIIAGLLAGHDTDTCVRMGLLAACLSLRSYEPISQEISTVSVNLEQVKARSWPEYSCPGIQSKTCQKPSDCDGCLGLYTCKLPRGKCGLKAVSRKTGTAQLSCQPAQFSNECVRGPLQMARR